MMACALVGLGLAALAGWIIGLDPLVQISPWYAPLRANTAISLLIFGLLLLALEFGHRSLAGFALIPALFGGLSLLQDVTGWELLIDQWLVSDHLADQAAAPGRIPAPVAISFLLAGIGFAWFSINRDHRRRTLTLAVVSSIMLSVGASTLAGYVLNSPAIYRWGMQTSTGPLAAIALIFLGSALLLLAWRENQTDEPGAPRWLPVPIMLGFATLSLVLWIGLRERETVYIGSATTSAINSFAGEIKLKIDQEMNAVERLARRWAQYSSDSPALLEVDAVTHLANAPACQSLAFISPELRTRWLHPARDNETLLDYEHSREPVRETALREVLRTQAPAISGTLNVSLAGRGFAIYAPIYRDGHLHGYVAAEYLYHRIFQEIEQRLRLGSDYLVSIHVGGETLHDPAGLGLRQARHLTFESVVTLFDRRVRIRMAASDDYLRRNRRFLPELALIAGLGITLLLGLSVNLARTAYTNLIESERSNRRLRSENEERRRIEAMLKISDERLRLALDSTLIGIFEWNLATGQTYYSPGLWSMLGYTAAQAGNSPEDWRALIHPEDVTGYQAAINRQSAGEAFIETEYRIRTGDSSWLWVYARSKAVTRDGTGQPLRIIGTLQDITPRKIAEDALRDSQSATRKLSLVASRTDNLVIITSPEGTVEWVNESFTRVMEYRLEEIIGSNPAAFMIGPETNPRTVRRIRAAATRGTGLSCDVINYSKSGRKYHLQLEIQPVRNEAGRVENFIAILADITARVETENALRRAKAEADATSRAKSEFLASLSHEIRTPMNGVIGMTSLLLETNLGEEQRDYVNTIRTSGEALLTIINDILDFSKIESGRMELEHLPFELNVCLEETLDLFSAEAGAKQLELSYSVEEGVPAWIIGDVTRLRQVLVNLVNNAVKFTPAGRIDLLVRRAPVDAVMPHRPGQVLLEFTVRDTGIGIPGDRFDRLFKPFSQIDSSTTRKYGGTGLGLAICHRLCNLMGGSIRAHSATDGSGSRFIFTMLAEPGREQPQTNLPPPPADLLQGPVLCVEDNEVNLQRLERFFHQWGIAFASTATPVQALDWLDNSPPPSAVIIKIELFQSESGSTLGARLSTLGLPILMLLPNGNAAVQTTFPFGRVGTLSKPIKNLALVRSIQGLFQTSAELPPSSFEEPVSRNLGEEIPLNVLLVEDNPVNQKVALRFLDRLGYRADAVANGLEAVAATTSRNYDLLFMDLQMPEMDGFEASRQIRRTLPASRQPKIVALTANALQGDRDLCLAAGMDDYITKPVKLQELVASIRRQFPARSQRNGA